jgi:hypothetical protein
MTAPPGEYAPPVPINCAELKRAESHLRFAARAMRIAADSLEGAMRQGAATNVRRQAQAVEDMGAALGSETRL